MVQSPSGIAADNFSMPSPPIAGISRPPSILGAIKTTSLSMIPARTALRFVNDECFIEPARFVFEDSTFDLNSRAAKHAETASIDLWIRVLDGSYHARHASLDKCRRARRSSALMRAWLQRRVHRCAARFGSCLLQRDHLGMTHPIVRVKALANGSSIFDDDRTHHRARAG